MENFIFCAVTSGCTFTVLFWHDTVNNKQNKIFLKSYWFLITKHEINNRERMSTIT